MMSSILDKLETLVRSAGGEGQLGVWIWSTGMSGNPQREKRRAGRLTNVRIRPRRLRSSRQRSSVGPRMRQYGDLIHSASSMAR